MPPLPKKTICAVCRKVTSNPDGYCDEHRSVKEEKEKANQSFWRKLCDQRRGSPSRRGYDNQWCKFRRLYLRHNPLCVQCEKEGRIVPASEIHHIVRLSDGGDKYAEDNLMPLCHSCHSTITANELDRKAYAGKECGDEQRLRAGPTEDRRP